ncbi:MAG: sulfatase-like hydrolase/transferase [Planctomycetaceae bacterium]
MRSINFILILCSSFLLQGAIIQVAVAEDASSQLNSSRSNSSQPNIVIFLADDQGWGDLSLHGNTNLSTPHIDSIAHEGAQFDRFFVCPVCAPTRAEFLTGRYYARTGVRGVSRGEGVSISMS